ncbi:LacI family DNA-binding transcriptional regulator [Gimibacter soli]|uniref:LacI family DNA-binding transcriptional regulator n=1 Tax=Gimibacter soli TaxID=3024400 RepID=A0AAE9XU29_9PROT|nr:LacI family DNA-binding transcriptional regulator [Gimibacter soli]WCL53478.1 LacI family DNA-binding transcriptional regulator [Gimibacter soli]
MATIRDVASLAGVSRATVTRALQEPDKVSPARLSRVKEAIRVLGYRPNMLSQTFRKNQARTIVVLAPNLANPFFSKVIAGIVAAADERDFRVLVGATDGSVSKEFDFVRMVESRLADGIIQMNPFTLSERNAVLPHQHVPAVSVAGVPGTPYSCVRIDNRAAAKECILHLAASGHQKIGIVTGPTHNSNTMVRLEGVKAGLEEAGLSYNPNLVREGDFRMLSGLQATESLMQDGPDPKPTAIFCMNDEMALGAIRALHTLNLRVPEDVSIVGFDSLDFSAFFMPPLTTVEQPGYDMGVSSANILADIIEGVSAGQESHDVVLPYRFIIRQSTAPVRVD